MEKETKTSWALIGIFAALICFWVAGAVAMRSGSLNGANLTVWDDSDSVTIRSGWNIYFYANYTNSTSGGPIFGGNCTMRFQDSTFGYGEWVNATFDVVHSQFEFNRTFNYKGTYSFETNCSNFSILLINITDNFTITNSIPVVSKEQGADWIDLDGNPTNHNRWQCTEDINCYYNFSSNVTDADINDVLSYAYGAENTTLTDFTFNTTTGILFINVTHSNYTGSGKRIELKVRDNDPDTLWQSGLLEVDIADVNDPPVFVGLENRTFNATDLFTYVFNVTDEENNIPFVLNITFLNCSTAAWSTRNNTNCTLFTPSHYSFNQSTGRFNMSLITTREDVGSYLINFSVTDSNALGNKTTSQTVNFTVLNMNSAPYFTYVCNNERNATEDTEFTCWINARDIDEIQNLTFSINYSWFTFNGLNNSITVLWNVSSDYNFSAMANFTPRDAQVGNWSVNLTLLDIGAGIGAPKRNSTSFRFFIENIEDNVSLNAISNQVVYENRTIFVNAYDDDLLVPDKSVKNEVLAFASNTSWVSISPYSTPSGFNYTIAKIFINYDFARNYSGAGNYTIKVNVTDTGGNNAQRSFVVSIESDTAAVWSPGMQTAFSIYENNLTYFDFSQNVTDAEGDTIIFSFTNDSEFPSFRINASSGVINFTPGDADVGYHLVTINAYDGKLNSFKSFEFTVENINDLPYIETPLSGNENLTINGTTFRMNTTEDKAVQIRMWVQDNDFRVPSLQKSFYNESLRLNLTIQGPNTALFEFARQSGFPTDSGTNANKSYYVASFTPSKADIGSYNITINISDASNSSIALQFNFSITGVNHAPALMNLTNHTTAVNRTFYYRINATDSEDGNSTAAGNSNFTFRYNFTSGINIFDAAKFNSITGAINLTFNPGQGGRYHLSITVNDSSGAENSADFWIYVYDFPNVTFPSAGYIFNFSENVASNLTFLANHSIGDNLTYVFYISDANGNDFLRKSMSYYGNNANFTWQFTPNFTDETYGNLRNLTLVVYPSDAQLENATALNTTASWLINISHTNAPVTFLGYIGDKQAAYTGNITINLSAYFSDIDYSDPAYNQTINFSLISNSTSTNISWSVSNWILTLFSSSAVKELMTINSSDSNGTNMSLTSAVSNNFIVEFTTPPVTVVPVSSGGGGGGGGGGTPRPILLKMMMPDPMSAYKKDRIVLPIFFSNEGKTNLFEINLTATIAKNNVTRSDVKLSFDRSYLSSLMINEKANVTLTAIISTEEAGLYEITINASVKDPKYSDWGKIYLTVNETNKTTLLEKLLFTEEFIAENPECAEINEIVEEAREYYDASDYKNCLEKINEAVEACKYAIKQKAIPREKIIYKNDFYRYSSFAAVALFIVLILYYFYKRVKIRRIKKMPKNLLSPQ